MDDERQQRLWSRARRLSQATAVVALTIALLTLAGWSVGSEALKRILPDLPSMVPATALGLALLAGAVLALRRGDTPGRRRLGWLLAAMAAVLAVLMFASHVWSPQAPPERLAALGERMSRQTASGMLLLALGLLCVDRPGRLGRASQWLVLASILPPLVALEGYTFGEHHIFGDARTGGIALHTAASLLLLALGALLLRPDRGPVAELTSRWAGGAMARRLLPAALLPVLGGVALGLARRADLLGPSLSWALLAVLLTLAVAGVVWRNAARLNQLHAEQARAQQRAREDAERQRHLAAENARLYEDARAAARLREDMLAVVSHDLKNPLATVRLSTAVLRRRLEQVPEPEGLTRGVDAIDRAATHMLDLITQLLDAARLDAGQALGVEQRAEPLAALVEEALARIEALATRKHLRLEQRVGGDVVALCDRERILQVMSNLLGNALKFTPEEGTVTVEAGVVAGEARVSVRDTGPGIPAEDQAHLFERYWQAPDATRKGSGLGLYIARGLVTAHGGRIWVDSTVGAGTTFTFTLPLVPERRASQPRLDSPEVEV